MTTTNSLIGKKAKLNNVNEAYYKHPVSGIIDWVEAGNDTNPMIKLNTSKAIYCLKSLDIEKEKA